MLRVDKYFASKSGIVRYKWCQKRRRTFPLKRGTRQGDPISAYLFIISLAIVSIFIRESKNLQSLKIFNNQFLHTVYADDTILFLNNENSVTEAIQILKHFSIFSVSKQVLVFLKGSKWQSVVWNV